MTSGDISFVLAERGRAAAWKERTPTLPEEARVPAPYVMDGRPVGRYHHCLPASHAQLNLLPEVRDDALAYFAETPLVWHQATSAGPTNHLLSSQVQCVNALGQLSDDPGRVRRAFGSVLDIAESLEIEDGRYVAFEYIGQRDHLGEERGRPRRRGSMATSADAAIRYRSSDGAIEIALIEWKYTESYLDEELEPRPGTTRQDRYRALWESPENPCHRDVVPYDDLFVEPFYQLMRQQLLAWQMEVSHELDAERVRVVHVSPAANAALRESLNRPSHRKAGDDVFATWKAVAGSDRFVTLDSSAFLDISVTSADYVDRYGAVDPV